MMKKLCDLKFANNQVGLMFFVVMTYKKFCRNQLLDLAKGGNL